MADLCPDRASSSRAGNVGADSTRNPDTEEAAAADPPDGASPALPAALDRLRDAAAAHDAQLPEPGLPGLPRLIRGRAGAKHRPERRRPVTWAGRRRAATTGYRTGRERPRGQATSRRAAVTTSVA